MPCFHPYQVWQHVNGGKVLFKDPQLPYFKPIKIPCGQCIGCRLDKSRKWAIRCLHEASMYDDNIFLTLTYNDANLPEFGDLDLSHIQNFFKKLRKKISPHKIRVFYCGEYGDNTFRPHYHAIIFGYCPDDLKPLRMSHSGLQLFTSDIIQSCWDYGFHQIGSVSFESIAYVARYTFKKMTGDKAVTAYGVFDPDTGELIYQKHSPFVHMSNRPGLGYSWLKRYKSEVIAYDGKVHMNGHFMGLPKYYLEQMQKLDPDFYKYYKEEYLPSLCKKFDADPNNSFQRLKVRERLLKYKWKNHSRDLPIQHKNQDGIKDE